MQISKKTRRLSKKVESLVGKLKEEEESIRHRLWLIDKVQKNIQFTKSMSDIELRILNNNYLKVKRYSKDDIIKNEIKDINDYSYKDRSSHILINNLSFFDPLMAYYKKIFDKYSGFGSPHPFDDIFEGLKKDGVYDKLINRKLTKEEYLDYIKGNKEILVKSKYDRLKIKSTHKEAIKFFWLNYKYRLGEDKTSRRFIPEKRH